MTKRNNLIIPSINQFNFKIDYSETFKKNHTFEIDLHTHQEFEIYINISGDVSFLVENKLYPLSYGDIIFVRPGQEHHCVYRSDLKHKFFWILLDMKDNPLIADYFNCCKTNYISPENELKEELISLCFDAVNDNLTDADKLYCFFRILHILKTSSKKTSLENDTLPEDLAKVLSYIDGHISENLQVSDISKALYISESTIRRRFKEYLNTSPLLFIQKRKLHYAAKMLKQGESVINAGINVGYADNSYFIQLFKREYGVTPYHYKKLIRAKKEQ